MVDYVVLQVVVMIGKVVLVVRHRVVVVLGLTRLPLGVLLVLHPPVLEPDLDLSLGKVEISCQLPALLLGDVGVEEELFLQLQGLEFRVGFAFFPYGHLTRPF